MTDNISMLIKHAAKDAHVHLSFLSDENLQTYFQKSALLNIKCFAMGGYDQNDWQKQIEIKKINSKVKTCFGLHPWVIEKLSEEELKKQWAYLLSIVDQADAIGEAGIDRFRASDERIIEKQTQYFLKSLELSQKFSKPLVLHIVKAHEMAFQAIDQFSGTFGIAHSFSGSYEVAKEYIKRGFLISIGHRVLSEGFMHMKDAIERLSLEELLVESDESEDPSDLYKVAEKVADLKNCAISEVIEKTAANFDKVFK